MIDNKPPSPEERRKFEGLNEPKPLTCKALDHIATKGCGNPDCNDETCKTAGLTPDNPVYLSQRCHPGQGVDVVYWKDANKVRLLCHECERIVLEIAVAE